MFWVFRHAGLLHEDARVWLNEHNSEFILALLSFLLLLRSLYVGSPAHGLRAISKTQYEAAARLASAISARCATSSFRRRFASPYHPCQLLAPAVQEHELGHGYRRA